MIRDGLFACIGAACGFLAALLLFQLPHYKAPRLTTDYQLEPWAAHELIGAVGRYDVVTAAGTMALRIPKKYLK